jgi:Alternative oxidase.
MVCDSYPGYYHQNDSLCSWHRTNEPAPEIAKDYWRLSPNAKLLDVMYAVRSDETTHRFVNHSLANLNVNTDVNPFALREPDMHVKGQKIAWAPLPPSRASLPFDHFLRFKRSEAEQYIRESHDLMLRQKKQESQSQPWGWFLLCSTIQINHHSIYV